MGLRERLGRSPTHPKGVDLADTQTTRRVLELLPDYEALEGTKEYSGRWQLGSKDMTWHRPEHYYFRSAISGKVEQFEQLRRGPSIRPWPLVGIEHLEVPLAVMRSHPDTPGVLSEEDEGRWLATNPSWPEMTVNHVLRGLGMRAAWEDSMPATMESLDLVPELVEGVNLIECDPFDPTPLTLNALRVYVLAKEPAETASAI